MTNVTIILLHLNPLEKFCFILFTPDIQYNRLRCEIKARDLKAYNEIRNAVVLCEWVCLCVYVYLSVHVSVRQYVSQRSLRLKFY